MLPLTLGQAPEDGYRILCLGAHSDDIEIGCAGTVLRLLSENRVAEVTWVVLSGGPERAREARRGARRVLGRLPGARIVQREFRDGFFPYDAVPIKEFFEELKGTVSPDLIFTHHGRDAHQDHRFVAELTHSTFRRHLVLEYEVMKTDGDLGNPQVYVPLEERTVRRKVEILMDCFGSQRSRTWFSEDAFRALMRLRGIEGLAASGHAEAFHARRIVL